MAECSYARCLQERRHIKRELMKWSKDMLYIIGLERVAEELMGRRKWKQYQEALTRSQLSADITNLDQIDISNQKYESEQKLEKAKENSHQPQQQQPFENDVPKIKTEVIDVNERTSISPHIKKENFESSSVVTEESIKLNNNTNTSHSIHNNNSKKDNEELLPPPTSPTPPPSIPIDWTPNEKCNFCVDGKLLTVNEKGELVAESSPALSEADLANRLPGDTDSDSGDSLVPDARVNARKILTPRIRDSVPPNMTSLESMAAQWSAIQSLPQGLGQLYPSILFNLTQQVNSATPTTSETSAAAISPSLKGSPSPSDLTGEQPLDLSSKPSPNSSIGGDTRHVHRAKPRVTPCTGRRTYTEEELNNALQDIMSGRLGTRRAAVQYNIPRSTLRNKVYKISSGAKRETPTSLHHPASLEDLADVDDDKQDLSGDEEDSSGDKFLGSSLASHQADDLASRFADANLAASIQKMCAEQNSLTHQHQHQQQQQQQQQQHHQPHSDIQIHNKPTTSLESQPKRKVSTPQPPPQQTSPHHQHNFLQSAVQNALLQRSLLSSGLHPNFEEAVLQMFNALLMKQDASLINPQLLMQLQQPQRSPQSTQQQQQQHLYPSNATGHPSTAAAVAAAAASFQNRQPKSETPETASSVDLNETLGDDPSVILKIPSYKPVAGSSTSSISSAAAAAAAAAALCNNKNGENLSSSSPKIPTASALLGANTSAQQQLHHQHHLHQHHNPSVPSANNIPGISPPLIRHASGESQSPPTLSLRDVIANSISRTFSQQANKDTTSPSPAHSSSSAMDHNDQYKRPSISVIKNIGGTDTSRFATAPNLLGGHHNSNHHHQQHHHHQHHSQNAANNNLAGGKGTRPKRGKYRNYDRDSLVEAVKAVQRGEMSVHRAGSYYGVPHSTLEYKVKERHLMRPRKREPKPQPPLDDRTGGSSTSTGNTAANSSKNSNIPGLSAVNSLDKLSKSSSAAGNQKQSAAGKSNPPFPTTSPNGMKISPVLFDPSVAAQLQYSPHLFWPGGFGPLPMDLHPRSQAAAAAAAVAAAASGGAGNPAFAAAANAELFKSQMLQRFHEDRGPPNAIGSPPTPPILSNSTSSSTTTNNSKSVREIAENLYDTTGANGSFLDGIIRKTLDRKSSDLTQGALLDQLVKNSKPPPPRLMMNNERMTGDLLKLKRPGSPMQYHPAMEIKRERASPTSDSSNSDSERNHRQDSDSEPPSSHHSVGLHHALLGANNDLNGAQHGLSSMSSVGGQLMGSENNLAASSSSSVTTSILHEKLGQIKSETEDSL